MGLTIHYELIGDQLTKEAVPLLLQEAQQFAVLLQGKGALAEVSEVRHFTSRQLRAIKAQRDPEWLWAVTQAGGWWVINDRFLMFDPVEAYIFRTWPGEGCEEANFGLCRFPASTTEAGEKIKTGLRGWHWKSFCKTQYANEKGIKHFLRCHLAVVTMLDFLQSKIKLDVTDEGGFWKKRDVEALVKEIGEWDAFIAGFAGVMLDTFGEGSVNAPILNRPDFEYLEMKGLKKLGDVTQLTRFLSELGKLDMPPKEDEL